MRSSRSSVIQDSELLAEGQNLELESCPVLKGGKECPKQRNEDSSHAMQVTLAEAKRSTIPRLTEFLAGTVTTAPCNGRQEGLKALSFKACNACNGSNSA